ncbi:MAG: hypothetical protein GF330_13850 [Candidatus Eisenbacteria bacterium]|nr:hypothetical protein [Candidatus Eisenbacteria bacterium]
MFYPAPRSRFTALASFALLACMLVSGCGEEETNIYMPDNSVTVTLSGRALSYPGAEPVDGATFRIPGASISGTCDTTGCFEVAGLSSGTYQVVLSAPGHATTRVSLSANPGNPPVSHLDLHKDFYLAQTSAGIDITLYAAEGARRAADALVDLTWSLPYSMGDHDLDDPRIPHQVTCDSLGVLSLSDLPATDLMLTVYPYDVDGDSLPDCGTMTESFALQPGKTFRTYMVLPSSQTQVSVEHTNLPSYGQRLYDDAAFLVFSTVMDTLNAGSVSVQIRQDNYPYGEIAASTQWLSPIELRVTPDYPLVDATMDYDIFVHAEATDGSIFEHSYNSVLWTTGIPEPPVGLVASNIPSGSTRLNGPVLLTFSAPMDTTAQEVPGAPTVAHLTQDNHPYDEIGLRWTWLSELDLEIAPRDSALRHEDMDYNLELQARGQNGLEYSESWRFYWLYEPRDCDALVSGLRLAEGQTEIDFNTVTVHLTWEATDCRGGYRIYAKDDRNNPGWVHVMDEPTDYDFGTITAECTLPPAFDRYDVDGVQSPFSATEVTFSVLPARATNPNPGDPHATLAVIDNTPPSISWIEQIGSAVNDSDESTPLEIAVGFTEHIDMAVPDPILEIKEAGGDSSFTLDPMQGTWSWDQGRMAGRFAFSLEGGCDASGDSIRIRAATLADLSGNAISGETTSPWMSLANWSSFDFESSGQGWTRQGQGWAWGAPSRGPEGGHQSEHCWGTTLHSDYGDNWDTTLHSPSLRIPAGGADLEFWKWSELDAYDDHCYLEIVADGDVSTLATFTGYATEWERMQYSLDVYAGQLVEIRFHFTSNYHGHDYEGFFVDDLSVSSQGGKVGLWP